MNMNLLHSAVITGCAFMFPVLASCAAADVAGPLAPRQAALVNAVCSNVMQIIPQAPEYGACTTSLSQSLAVKIERQAVARSYEDCRQRNLTAGMSQFANCALDEQENTASLANNGKADAGLSGELPDLASLRSTDNGSESFLSQAFVSRRQHIQREKDSCAALGLLPGSAPFVSCVSDLESTIFNTDHPPG